MAVVIDSINTTPATATAVTALNLTTLTVGAGSNRGLYATLTLDGTPSAVTLTWDSGGTNQAMTLLGSIADGSGAARIYAFGLVAPTSGARTLRATWTGTADAILAASSFTNVNPAGGANSFRLVTAASGVTTAPGAAVLAGTGSFTSAATGIGPGTFQAAVSAAGVGVFTSKPTLPGLVKLAVGGINSRPVNVLAVNELNIATIELFQALAMQVSGSFAAAARPAISAAVTVRGGGAFTVAGSPNITRTIAPMTGAAAFAATSAPTRLATSMMPAVTTLSISGETLFRRDTAALAGVGLFQTLSDAPVMLAAVTMPGAASFAAQPSAAFFGAAAASMAGTVTFSGLAVPAILATAGLSATGSFVLFGGTAPQAFGLSAMAAAGSFSSLSTGFVSPAAVMVGVGALSGSAAPGMPATVTMSGAGAFLASISVYQIAASLAASGSFGLLPATPSVTTSATMPGAGLISLSGIPVISSNVTLAATGSLIATLNSLQATFTQAAVASFILSGGSPRITATTIMAGASALSSIGLVTSQAVLTASGAFVLSGVPSLRETALFPGIGLLSVSSEGMYLTAFSQLPGIGAFSSGGLGFIPAIATFLPEGFFNTGTGVSQFNAMVALQTEGLLITDLHLPDVGVAGFNAEGELVADGEIWQPLRLVAPPSRTTFALV